MLGHTTDEIERRLDRVVRRQGLPALAPSAVALLRATWHPDRIATVPPWSVAAVASGAGAVDPLGLGLCMAASYAAAHAADDLADGDADGRAWAFGNLDVVRLLAVSRACLRDLNGVDRDTRDALARELDALQLGLCDGQQLDLEHRERAGGSRWAIAEGKAGVGIGGYLAMAARCAVPAADPDRWRRVGLHFGCLGQACSDVFDLVLGPASEDWEKGLPSFFLGIVLDSAVGDAVRLAMAGPRRETLPPVRALLAAADGVWAVLQEALEGRCAQVEAEAGAELALAPLVQRARDLTRDAVLARPQGRPPNLVELPSWAALKPRAQAFVEADPALEEAVTVHRWRFLGQDEVRASTFGRLVVLDMLERSDVAVHGDLPQCLDTARTWGWRYFETLEQIPPDIDTTGLALRVLSTQPARAPGLNLSDLSAAAQTILDEPSTSGLLSTWRPHPRCRGTLAWEPRACPVATANALAGLHAASLAGIEGAWSARMDDALHAVCAWADGGAAHTSLYYPLEVARGWVLWNLVRLATRAPSGVGVAVKRLSQAIVDDGDLRGGPASVLGAAFELCGLRAAGALSVPVLQVRVSALCERMDVDGGFPAAPSFSSVAPGLAGLPATTPRFYRSRLLSTAVAWRALSGCERLPRGVRVGWQLGG